MRQGERLHVLQVRPQVPAQAELRVPPQAEAQDRVRDGGPVRQLGPGSVHGLGPGPGLLPVPALGRTLLLLAEGRLRDAAALEQ